jgi:hypothetical protein
MIFCDVLDDMCLVGLNSYVIYHMVCCNYFIIFIIFYPNVCESEIYITENIPSVLTL